MEKVKPELNIKFSHKADEIIGQAYSDFYKFRNFRSGNIRQFQYNSFDDYIRKSRELFWNSIFFESEDLSNLDLQLTIPFVRKEILEFLSRLTSLGIKPRPTGDSLDSYGIKILNGMYQRWRFKSNDKVNKYWQSLYGAVNGTVCTYVGFNNTKKTERTLTGYDPESGAGTITEKTKAYWNDVETQICPIEDIYLAKIYERDIQKQGRIIWKTQMDMSDFKREYKKYKYHIYVVEGSRIAEDSLYFQLLGGTGVCTTDKVEVMKVFDTDQDQYLIMANGIWLNPIGEDTAMPMPFKHKLMPFTWAINEPIDEKFAYGLSMSFKIKDPHKMLNASYVMLMERELRAINEPILSSDIETPEIIYKTGKVIPVGDVTAYKQLEMSEASSQFFTSLNSLQGVMTSQAQGGSNQIIPSVQPKSAKEISQMEQLRQQAMGGALLMYYDLLRQEILLCLKTMLQFYPLDKFSKDDKDRIIKTLMITDMPLTQGGVGNIELRLVRESEDPINLYFEAVKKSLEHKKQTEIIEAPVDLIQNLEFYIKDVDLEPQKTDEVERAVWTESVFNPMMQNFVPMGLVSPEKAFLRFLEKNGEYSQDWAQDQIVPNLIGSYGGAPIKGLNREGQAGAMAQSVVGQQNGQFSAGGQGFEALAQPQ